MTMDKKCGARFSNMLVLAKPYLLCVGLQFGMAGTFIITKACLDRGMSRFVLTVYRNAVAAFVLAPFAIIFERNIRPKMTMSIFMQIQALAFLEPVIDQGFTCLGMQYTSATFASAIMNAVPSVTFVIAVILRLESVKLKELRSEAKVIGTLVTFGGALLMTLYKGPQINLINNPNSTQKHESHSLEGDKHWFTGTLFLCFGCFAWSSFYILQSITVKRYPAELSLSSLICLAGALQSAVVAVIADHNPRSWAIGFDYTLYGPLYAGVMSSGIAYYVQGLVMKSRGPVFMTSFNPLLMINVATFGSFLLGEQIYLGSIIGATIIVVGLYSVVWGKAKDYPLLQHPSATATKDTEAPELPTTSSTLK
ncbi:WAT1-related protein At4g08290-like [Vigna unguiculata]|uniref:WAT1-related protein n=1 Tax=Vigna unguiculata TaxID=3917 RepID=A0A4D6MHU3_VIGUN|nr:WAT1-related protein At4g08290-like [Vigna unguiculata]QCE00281.1 WAT1-related protein [Vigna unguiculata]